MKSKSKRKFLRNVRAASIFLVGANLPVWAINVSAKAAASEISYKLQKADRNGLMLMKGFTSRIIARSDKKPFSGSNYKWHRRPDGGATFPKNDGGWIYVSNSEVGNKGGGVGAIEFDKNANIINAYSICSKTNLNCAGGPTPWNTWLSCEEHEKGFTWECDPYGKKKPIKIPSLGMFVHEAAAVDPKTSIIYQTEDTYNSGFYRFVPEKKIKTMGQLLAVKGKFQVMEITAEHKVKWNNVPNPLAKPTGSKRELMFRKENKNISFKYFPRGEGAWYHNGKVHFATTTTHTIWTYDISSNTCKVLYRGEDKVNPVLKDPDNVVVSNSGLVMAAEDRGNMEICGISNKTKKAFPILRIVNHHKKSEVTGPAFDPSGTRLYFSSQNGKNGKNGITFEVTGPFDSIS
tara:strand:- start:58 stop:1269 length:1212 start_codon:yes stop_codon:yes gene_type:complete